jgi:hypothetical protein
VFGHNSNADLWVMNFVMATGCGEAHKFKNALGGF